MWFVLVILLSSTVTPTNGMMGIQAVVPAAVAAGPVGWVALAGLAIASIFIPMGDSGAHTQAPGHDAGSTSTDKMSEVAERDMRISDMRSRRRMPSYEVEFLVPEGQPRRVVFHNAAPNMQIGPFDQEVNVVDPDGADVILTPGQYIRSDGKNEHTRVYSKWGFTVANAIGEDIKYPQNPDTKPGVFDKLTGSKAFEHTEDGSIWERDTSSHGGPQWKRWKGRKQWERRDKPNSVWPDGRVRK